MRFRKVMRWDSSQKIYRLFRVMWDCNQEEIGMGKGFSNKITLALHPSFFKLNLKEGFEAVLFGIRFSYKRSYGGRFV